MFNTKKKSDMLKKLFAYSLCLCMLTVGFSACGASGQTSGQNVAQSESADGNSPTVSDCIVDAGCDGGEDDQYVDVVMKFDRNVTYSSGLADELRVVIGGERVKTENIDVSQDSSSKDEVKLRITGINKVTNGVLEITSTDSSDVLKSITDETGKYSAESPDIKKLIPSGVAIEPVGASEAGEQPEWTKVKVTSPPSHRSMVWIQLVRNGEAIEPDDLSAPDILDDTAVGIHEHEFLWATNESVAEDIAKAVNDFYGERFKAESSGDEVTITATGSSADNSAGSELELRLYEY